MIPVRVGFERINNPHLAEGHGCSQGSGVGVTRDELDVLDPAALMSISLLVVLNILKLLTDIRNSNSIDNGPSWEIPEPKRLRKDDIDRGLENTYRRQEVRCEDQVLIPVDRETVWVELLVKNIQGTGHILRPLVDDRIVGVSLDQTTGRRASGRTHVREEEATIRFSADLVSDGREGRNVGLLVSRIVDVGDIKVISGILKFE